MKKIFQVISVVAIAAGFVACGGAANSSASADSTAVVEISVLDTTGVEVEVAVDSTVVVEIAE